MKKTISLLVLILFIAVILVFGSCVSVKKITGEKVQRVTTENGLVKIPTEEVSDGIAHHYYILLDDTKVGFFLLMSNDGVIRAAFDACEDGACGSPRSTFSQKGDYMVCYHCGMPFPEEEIGVTTGYCNPTPLDRTHDADYVIITLADLEQGKRLFTGYPLKKKR